MNYIMFADIIPIILFLVRCTVKTLMIKRSKMEEANRLMKEARVSLLRFQEELKDVNLSFDLNLEVGDFLSFADYFFDGVVADFMVQSKISDATEKVAQTIRRVQQILNKLELYI